MRIRVYQVRTGDGNGDLIFSSSKELAMWGYSLTALPRAAYDLVFDGELAARTLGEVYARLQLREHLIPDGYEGRSLSVSDVVEIIERGDSLLCQAEGLWYVDAIGFLPCDWDVEAAGGASPSPTSEAS